jgi:UDP-N-acetylglucosamine--N-acetylmuramyl-(pentapeptide) pyrophosphoryl-undecaprenol N-acetylglucosamine transferase
VVAAAIPAIAERPDVQLVVLTGPANETIVADPAAAAPGVHVLPFLERMELAYAVADLAVSRAGSTTIAEQTICGIPAILVPYPHATEHHQEANAREIERAGAAEIVLDAALTPELFVERIGALLDDPGRLTSMSANAVAWAKPDAAERFGTLVAEVAKA